MEMKPIIPEAPKDVSLSFCGYFMETSKGNIWSGVPNDLCEFLEKIEGTISGIVDRMEPNYDYTITISVVRK